MAKKPKRRIVRAGQGTPDAARAFVRSCDHLAELLADGRVEEARELFAALNATRPDHPALLRARADLAFRSDDPVAYCEAVRQLVELQPEDRDVLLNAAAAHMATGQPAGALLLFRELAKVRQGDLPEDRPWRETLAQLEREVPEGLQKDGFAGPDALEMGAAFEWSRILLGIGKVDEALAQIRPVVAAYPRFVPALNNMSLCQFMAEADLEGALATTRSVLEIDPANVQALANLVRFQICSGDRQGAQGTAERLKASTSPAWDRRAKIMEALSLIGDDAGVLEVFARESEPERDMPSTDLGFMHHLAAVASLRLGREKEARKHWQRALHIQPGLQLARENLEDLALPPSQRNGPWPFELNMWLPVPVSAALAGHVTRAAKRGHRSPAPAAGLLAIWPALTHLVPSLLERGDVPGRVLALLIASTSPAAEMGTALRDFALGKWGTDELRGQALTTALEAGAIAAGPAKMWMDGQWREMLVQGWVIHGELQEPDQPPQVVKLVSDAVEASHDGKYKEAERLLREALALAPGDRIATNNLAAALAAQGRIQEARHLSEQLLRDHPDYLFARTNMAGLLAHEGRADQAMEVLQPLFSRPRLHVSEFRAVAFAYAHVLEAKGDRSGARHWRDIGERGPSDMLTPAAAGGGRRRK